MILPMARYGRKKVTEIIGRDGVIVYASITGEESLTGKDLVGKPFSDIVDFPLEEAINMSVEKAFEVGDEYLTFVVCGQLFIGKMKRVNTHRIKLSCWNIEGVGDIASVLQIMGGGII